MGEKTTTQETPSDEMARFEGFSTVDGAVQEKAAPAATEKKPAAKAAEKAAEAEGEHDDEHADGGGADGAGKPAKSAQERINKAVAKQRAAERRAEELERRIEALERGGRQPQAPQPQTTAQQQTPAPGGDKEPVPTDYEGGEYDARYIRDVAKWAAKEELRQTSAAQQAAREQQTVAERRTEMVKKRDALTEKAVELYDDFEEVVFDDGVIITPTVGELILDSEFGPQIAYALASDPEAQKRVSVMSPARQAAWFGRQEAELSSKTPDAGEGEENDEPPPPKVTKAPPVPRGNARGVGGSPKISADTTNFADFERMASGG